MASPIHVHVQDNTPLHLHLKKPKQTELSNRRYRTHSGTDRHSVRTAPRAKSKTSHGPWIPAPGKTSTKDKFDKQFKWESDKTQLEIHPPSVPVIEPPLRTIDLSTEEDNRLRCHLSEYEKKIESLMAEVGTLKNETIHMTDMLLMPQCFAECEPEPQESVEEKPVSTFHDKCFAEVKQVDAVQERTEKAFNALVKKAEKMCCSYKEEEAMKKAEEGEKQRKKAEQYGKLGESGDPNDSTLFVDRSHRINFDNQEHCNKNKAKNKVSFRKPMEENYPGPKEIKIGKRFNHDISAEAWQPPCSPIFPIHPAEKREIKKKMELKEVEDELGKHEELLEKSQVALEDKQKELNYIAKEFEETEKENQRLRKSVDRYQDNMAASLKEMGEVASDQDALLRQLVAAEVDGVEAGKQVAALRDIVSKLKYEKRLSQTDVNLLNKQRTLLLSKLEEFQTSNRTVRRLLQSQHKSVSDVHRLEEQRDILVKKISSSDAEALRFKSELFQRRSEIDQLTAQVAEEKTHAHTLNELNKSVEMTRAHLQRELRAKEMENNRLHVQLKNISRETDSVRIEAEQATKLAHEERESLAREKEGLKKAIRRERSRGDRAEQSGRVAEEKWEERGAKLEEARSQADAWRDRYQRASEENVRMEEQARSLLEKNGELEAAFRSSSLLSRGKEDDLKQRVDKLSNETTMCRSDVERYKSEYELSEHKLRQAGSELSALKCELKQREGVEKDLRTQLRRAKNEAEEALLSAERVERSSRRMKEDGTSEIERVRQQMLDRMRDLEPLPELLKETEIKLRDAEDRLRIFEQRSSDQTRTIADLTNKDEDRTDEASTLRQKLAALSDENRALEARLGILHAKLDDREVRAKESVLDGVGREEDIQKLKLKLDEAGHERDSYKRQLESAMADTRRAVEAEVDRSAARENAAQARVVDLETNLTRLKTEVASHKRAKEEAERRSQSKLQDARDRLEQAESTNRSMRNYVNFLKQSYNNVFGGDIDLTSTPVRSSAPPRRDSPF